MNEADLYKEAIEELQAEVAAQAVVIAVLANFMHDADVVTLEELGDELERIAPRVPMTTQVENYAASLRSRRSIRPHLTLVRDTE